MRVLLDTNIFISYLLHPTYESPSARIIHSALAETFTLLLPQELLEKLESRVLTKPYLRRYILQEDVRELLDLLSEVVEPLPSLEYVIPRVTRDPKDDYLLAYAVVYGVDYLVSGDKDLLVLGEVEGVRILSPREFISVLEQEIADDALGEQ